jgi:hypothetical protein
MWINGLDEIAIFIASFEKESLHTASNILSVTGEEVSFATRSAGVGGVD